MHLENIFENATPQQKEKALQCETVEELLAFAAAEKIDLSAEDAKVLFAVAHSKTGEISDDDLDNVAGGKDDEKTCPHCGSTDIVAVYTRMAGKSYIDYYLCRSCEKRA